MVDCLLSEVLGYKCKLYDSLYTLGSPQAMEGVSTTLCFCCILDNFLVNIFLRLKKYAITSSITSKPGTSQSVNLFTCKEDAHPKSLSGSLGHIQERQ